LDALQTEVNMSHEKTTLEIIAPTVEEAVEKGVAQLGIPADSLEVEVLDEGSKGFLGIGSRQARVRLSIKMEVPAVRETPARPAAAPAAPPVPAAPAAPMAEKGQAIAVETAGEEPEKDEAMTVAKQVVSDLVSRMKVNAQVQARYLKPEDEKDESVLLVDIRGQDLSILIGRRSETLNALQYIANLIVGKQLGYWVPLMIDVQGYRFRRDFKNKHCRDLCAECIGVLVYSGRTGRWERELHRGTETGVCERRGPAAGFGHVRLKCKYSRHAYSCPAVAGL